MAKISTDTVPVEKFRAACKQLRESKGWTWEEMALKGGVTIGALEGRVYKKDGGVDRAWTVNFFRRLAGLSAPPTELQLRHIRERSDIYMPDGHKFRKVS
jgi:hypothetical protein